MTLFTLNYARFKPEMGVPVRISNGYPRFVKYDITYAIKELYPAWALVKAGLPHEEFTRQYQEALDAVGVETIQQRFDEIYQSAGDDRLVLMCYEALDKGKTCHRRSFGRWWEDRTGEVVRELGPTGPEPTLFRTDPLW